MKDKKFKPDRISDYFRAEWKALLLVTVSGLIYNIGLLATPWFEGKLAGRLVDVLTGKSSFQMMLQLALFYVIVVAFVQGMRYFKRFYVRRFANNVNRRMKKILYHDLLRKSKRELEDDGAGSVMTKAISDVDDCVEGMRKFTTEVFDTGVALIGYCVMLLCYDWRLALICMLFPPISYFIAEKLKVLVQRTGAEYKNQAGMLSAATLDRASNAITYRIFSCEPENREIYEKKLTDYEMSAVTAYIWTSSFTPLYNSICMIGAVFILYFGAENVLGNGWSVWDIAAFTTFLSCYTRIATKASKAAKLFNSVHRAQVSWKRIKPFMVYTEDNEHVNEEEKAVIEVTDLGFSYPSQSPVFENISFSAEPGDIIGITGPVACGKSTLGRAFLNEYPYSGSVKLSGEELSELPDSVRNSFIGYLGHDTELQNDSIKNNILMGKNEDAEKYLRAVCLYDEVLKMPDGIDTVIGSDGLGISGGQAQRLALARTLCHKKPVLILDDPFSALDRETERAVFANLTEMAGDSIILLISHRLYLFPQLSQVIWLENGHAVTGTHDTLINDVPRYAELYDSQKSYAERGNRDEA